MFLIVILRTVIDVETFPLSELNSVRMPTMPGLKYSSTAQEMWTPDFSSINTDLDPFFTYGNYPVSLPDPTPDFKAEAAALGLDVDEPYNILSDFLGPLYFVPKQCLEKFSFQLPSVTMPIIAFVGKRDEVTAA